MTKLSKQVTVFEWTNLALAENMPQSFLESCQRIFEVGAAIPVIEDGKTEMQITETGRALVEQRQSTKH